MTDDEKLRYIKAKWNAISAEWKTLAEFKSFVKDITKAKVMNAIKGKVQHEADTHRQHEADEKARVEYLENFKENLDNL